MALAKATVRRTAVSQSYPFGSYEV